MRTVDGFWVGALGDDHEGALRRVESALDLVAAYDPRRLSRIRRDLAGVWVRELAGPLGWYDPRLGACELDYRFVMAAGTTVADIASTIVHEAAHARVQRRGIALTSALRQRIEVLCHRQEIAFAERLPDGAAIRERAIAWIEAPAEVWSDAAFDKWRIQSALDELTRQGVPAWARSIIGAVGRIVRATRRAIRRR